IEYVPMVLVLMLVLELNGTSAGVLHALGASLFAARLLHAFGLGSSTGTTPGRFGGTVLTWLVALAASGLALYTFVSRGGVRTARVRSGGARSMRPARARSRPRARAPRATRVIRRARAARSRARAARSCSARAPRSGSSRRRPPRPPRVGGATPG